MNLLAKSKNSASKLNREIKIDTPSILYCGVVIIFLSPPLYLTLDPNNMNCLLVKSSELICTSIRTKNSPTGISGTVQIIEGSCILFLSVSRVGSFQ